MHKKYNKFLIISFTLVFILGVYSYFYKDFVSEVFSANDAITSSLDVTEVANPTSEVSSKTTEDIAFLVTLSSLTKIKVDTSLFTDQSFNFLVDNNVKLESVPYGRINPFAPVLSVSPVTPINSVIPTNKAVINTNLNTN